MLRKIKQRFRDMGTIKDLCLGAEKHANEEGQKVPAAEHLVLAALELPDGTARKVFERLHVNPDRFRAAIRQQYEDALRSIGIEPPAQAAVPSPLQATARDKLYGMQPSGQSLMEQLVAQRKEDTAVPLLGAHVMGAASRAQYGVTSRAFRTMGVDLEKLAEAATAEIDVYASPSARS